MFDPTSNGVSLGRGYPLSSTPAEFPLVREDPGTRNGPSSRLHALTLFPPYLVFGCSVSRNGWNVIAGTKVALRRTGVAEVSTDPQSFLWRLVLAVVLGGKATL